MHALRCCCRATHTPRQPPAAARPPWGLASPLRAARQAPSATRQHERRTRFLAWHRHQGSNPDPDPNRARLLLGGARAIEPVRAPNQHHQRRLRVRELGRAPRVQRAARLPADPQRLERSGVASRARAGRWQRAAPLYGARRGARSRCRSRTPTTHDANSTYIAASKRCHTLPSGAQQASHQEATGLRRAALHGGPRHLRAQLGGAPRPEPDQAVLQRPELLVRPGAAAALVHAPRALGPALLPPGSAAVGSMRSCARPPIITA